MHHARINVDLNSIQGLGDKAASVTFLSYAVLERWAALNVQNTVEQVLRRHSVQSAVTKCFHFQCMFQFGEREQELLACYCESVDFTTS